MVLILSEYGEFSTSEVLQWLIYHGQAFIRINLGQDNFPIHINLNEKGIDFKFEYVEKWYSLSDFKAVWYRRGLLEEQLNQIDVPAFLEEVKYDFFQHQLLEIKSLAQLFTFALSINIPKNICAPDKNIINKQLVLYHAAIAGLKIPETLITSSKVVLLLFQKKYKRIATKAMQEVFYAATEEKNIRTFTKIIHEEHINSLKDTFSVSLFQQYIEKKIEIRSFYLCEDFYTMAIFCQNAEQTQEDFRKQHTEFINRYVPFKLPLAIENKLKKLMYYLNLNTGSIDLILSTDDEYYFLEVNPVGQYGMVSDPCNYYLDEKIALALQN